MFFLLNLFFIFALASCSSRYEEVHFIEDPFYHNLIIPVDICGMKTFSIIDTGGQFGAILNKQDIYKLQLMSSNDSCFLDLKGVFQHQKVYEGDFKIGSLRRLKIDITSHNDFGFFSDSKPEASTNSVINYTRSHNHYIGLNALKNFSLMIDYKNSKFIFYECYDPHVFKYDWLEIPFALTSEGIIFDVVVDKQLKKACLDTGASCSCILGKFKEKHIKKSIRISDNLLFVSDFFCIQIKNIDFDFIFGLDFFQRFKVFIDFNKKIMRIQKN